jgi:tryptophan halogenase
MELWENLRGFLSIHYKFNKRLNTEFWRTCWEKTDLAGAAPLVEYYQENGPSTVWKPMLVGTVNVFRFEGWLSMLLGQSVPHRARFRPSPQEADRWNQFQRYAATLAQRAYSVPEALKLIRSPQWTWPGYAN